MDNYNRITLIGLLNEDPKITKIKNRTRATFVLAVEKYVGRNNEPITDYFTIVSWGKLAEVIGSYLQKGKKVLINGHIQVRTYMKDKERQWVTEIVAENLRFLTPKT